MVVIPLFTRGVVLLPLETFTFQVLTRSKPPVFFCRIHSSTYTAFWHKDGHIFPGHILLY
jgi:hypothetical protein